MYQQRTMRYAIPLKRFDVRTAGSGSQADVKPDFAGCRACTSADARFELEVDIGRGATAPSRRDVRFRPKADVSRQLGSPSASADLPSVPYATVGEPNLR